MLLKDENEGISLHQTLSSGGEEKQNGIAEESGLQAGEDARGNSRELRELETANLLLLL